MTVGELIKELQGFDENIEVKLFDGVESFDPVEHTTITVLKDGTEELILSKYSLAVRGSTNAICTES